MQSLPIDCTIVIPKLGLPRSDKTNDLWELEDAPLGEYDAVFTGAGRTVNHRVVIREKTLTHLFINFITGTVEDRSPAPPPADVQRRPEGPPAPVVRQRPAPPPPPRELLARAQAAQRALEEEIAKIDVALKSGGAGLDQLAALVEKRNEQEAALAAARAAVARAQAAVADERRQLFLADYAKFQAVNENAAVPAAREQAAWRELVAKWAVREAGAEPSALVWRDGRADIARGKLRLELAGNWPARFGFPKMTFDGRFTVTPPADGGKSLTGLVFNDLAAKRHTLQLDHPAAGTVTLSADVKENEVGVVRWTPKLRPARAKLVLPNGAGAWRAYVGGKLAKPDTGGLIELEPDKEVTLLVLADGFLPFSGKLKVDHGAIERVEVAPSALPEVAKTNEQPRTVALDRTVGLELLPIPAGVFLMGSPPIGENGPGAVGPLTVVTLTKPFWLGKTEVTQAQWHALGMRNRSSYKGADRPVENVSWEDAMEFCRKLTARERAAGRLDGDLEYTLPTEAQWEYACRAGTTAEFAGELDAMAWYGGNAKRETQAVAMKQSNTWGLHDMHGNVWEWRRDWYTGYPGGNVSDPGGPNSGSGRVGRGGGLWGDAAYCRSAYRCWFSPGLRGDDLGFRLALSAVR